MGFEGREKKEASYHGPQPVGASENATGKGGLTQLEHLIQCGGTHHPEAVADLLQQFPNEQARMVELLQSTRGNAFVQQVLRVAALREGLRATDGRSDHGRASIPLDHQRSHFARATNAGYSAAPFSFATDPLDISDIDAEHSAGSSAQIIAALHGRIGRWEPQLSILMEQAKAPGDDASRQAMMAEFAQLLEAAEQVRQDLQVLEADAIKDMALAKSFANDAQADAKRARARAAESAKVARWAVRFLGTVRAAQGAFEMYVGCTASATGIGAVLGGAALCLHGADSLHTGSREMWSGDPQHTQISQSVAGVATIAGADEHTAAIIGDYGDAAVGMLGAWSVMRTAPLRYQEPTMTPSSQPRQLGDTGAKYRGGAGPELGSSETTVIGKTSGRPFNLDASGGSIRNLSTIGVKITARGLAVVEQHIARFAECPENSSMISRLRSIIAGDLQATQIDLNFYTHELREFVRYRRLGATSGDPGYEFWNNAHTATLEDYGLPGNTDRTLYVAP